MVTGAAVVSVNVAVPRTNPFKSTARTGIDKQPVDGPVEVRSPGSREHGLGSGLVGDFIGDRRNHGGDLQAVYAYSVEDLQWWADQLGVTLAAGQFGENLTVEGVDVNAARIGERWRLGTTELQVTGPRIPCATFRGWMNRPGWLRVFTEAARPGAYLSVVTGGTVRAGDAVQVTHRPAHEVTVSMVFRAVTREPELLPRLLEADDLDDELREMARRGQTFDIG